jgi:hypothetical protein
MSVAGEQYRKLGASIQLAGHSKLYLGGDHILQVSASGFGERYKRFYFRDIQAFIVMPNSWAVVEMIVLACCAIGSVAIALVNLDEPVIIGIFGTMGAVLVGFLVWSIVRGQSCRTHVRTAVQMETLPALNRVRKAKHVLSTLQSFIEASQATASVAPTAAEASPQSSPIAAPPTS